MNAIRSFGLYEPVSVPTGVQPEYPSAVDSRKLAAAEKPSGWARASRVLRSIVPPRPPSVIDAFGLL